MLNLLRHPVYSRLFAAQALALLGTGLMTVALALLAYDLAGERAGAVLGTALMIKMVAYVSISPLAAALLERFPRRRVLISADLVRGSVALGLPFVDAVWQVYVLIFVLQAASASFTPVFQAAIPDVLPDEEDYTRALSLSRVAYDVENLLSPVLAGVLLTVLSYSTLFVGTVAGFLASAALILSIALPHRTRPAERPFRERLTHGVQVYFQTPRLRGLMALNMAVAALTSFVLVNTVVLVRVWFGGAENDVALAMAAYGMGSVIGALALPRLIESRGDQRVMLVSATGSALAALGYGLILANGSQSWLIFLAVWILQGLFYAGIMTPAGRLLKRSGAPEDRQALFTAQFALSHACWLIGYPAAGWIGAELGMAACLLILGAVGALMAWLAARLWRG